MNTRTDAPVLTPTAHRLDRLARESMLLTGMDLIRSAGIVGNAELLLVVTAVLESCKFKDQHTEELSDMRIDLEGAVYYPPEITCIQSFNTSEPGQFDGRTTGVRYGSGS